MEPRLAERLKTPPTLDKDPFEALYFTEVNKRLNIAAQADSTASTVSVDSADASDLATAITLANELKADLNTLITDFNALLADHNALLAKLRAAGTQAT